MTEPKSFTVLGGGTAGWLTALMLQKTIPNIPITVIESEEIGILGAGEGTTPQFTWALDYLGIAIDDLVKQTNSTIKNGIKFTNWKNDETYYYHNFGLFETIDRDAEPILNRYNPNSLLKVAEKTPAKSLTLTSKLNELKNIPYLLNESNKTLEPFGNIALHFDAAKIAEYFRSIALQRGVIRVEGKVVETNLDKNSNIIGFKLDNEKVISTEFVFDCSGFARLLIGKVYNSEWVQYNLPVKSAIPFFLPIDENIPPYTESIAMKYGWVWKIPLQHRYGCGYVFDSDLISPEDAKKEVTELLGTEVDFPRVLNFSAGYYKETWKNNVISIGLSSGFIEPLEATSIMVAIESLKDLIANPFMLINPTQPARDWYNTRVSQYNTEVYEFVYYHYMSERNDTEFWTKLNNIDMAPKNIQELITGLKGTPLTVDNPIFGYFFGFQSWFEVSYGIGKLPFDLYAETAKSSMIGIRYASTYLNTKKRETIKANSSVSHAMLLSQTKEK